MYQSGRVHWPHGRHESASGDRLTMRIAERNGLMAGRVGLVPDWDPWAPITRGETAQLLVNLAAANL